MWTRTNGIDDFTGMLFLISEASIQLCLEVEAYGEHASQIGFRHGDPVAEELTYPCSGEVLRSSDVG